METFDFDVGTANGKFTPVKGKPLAKNVHEETTSGDFNYSSVVGMLLNFADQKHPDSTYAVDCTAKHMFCPKLVHKHALKRIGCYLKATSGKGLIMKPFEKLLKLECFPVPIPLGCMGMKQWMILSV